MATIHPDLMISLMPRKNLYFLGVSLIVCLVGGFNPSEKNMKVSWDCYSQIIPNICKKNKPPNQPVIDPFNPIERNQMYRRAQTNLGRSTVVTVALLEDCNMG